MRAVFVIVLAAFLGCSASLPRLDPEGAMESGLSPGSAAYPRTTVTLPQVADIRKVEIVPREPLRRFQVWVRTPESKWEMVKEFKGRFNSAFTLKVGMEGDAVRVLDMKPRPNRSSKPHVSGVSGSIKNMLIYGYWLNGAL